MIAKHEAEAGTGSGGFFAPSSAIWGVNREMVLLAAGGRALLMQLAHPKVAAGVAEHSHFKEDPLGRLHRTMNTMWSIVFDELDSAAAALEKVRGVHATVRGAIPAGEPLPKGTRYDALDANLLLWVHATLVDSAVAGYDLLVRPLGPAERARYYDDSKKLAALFDIPEAMVPPSLAEFDVYLQGRIAGPEIAVGPGARALAREILYPRPWLLRPAGPLFRLLTAGLLPERLRMAYGLDWNQSRDRKFKFVARMIRTMLPLAPRLLRVVPQARAAERRRG